MRVGCLSLCRALALWLVLGLTTAHARVLDDADVVETPAHYDLTVRFSCELRYLTHLPATEGNELRVRLTPGASCEPVIGSESLVTPVPAVVRSIELSAPLPGEVELLVRWRLSQRFVVVPSNDRQGLRIRILRDGEGADTRGKLLVGDMATTDVTTAYAINLESSRDPFDDADVERAQALLRTRIYRSEIDIDDTHWYRLRLGPIATRAEAEQWLLNVQNSYPHAWLAIADEQVDTQELVGDGPADQTAGNDAVNSAIVDAEADALWNSANERFRRKDYGQAIIMLTQLLSRSSGKHRAAALELRAIAHERRGELALAQADLEAFLRSDPGDRRASRVRRRLNSLRTASLPGRQANAADDNAEGIWHWNGGIAQYYRRDDNRLTVAGNTQSSVGQNALLNDVELTARYRGIATDTRFRVSAGYNHRLATQSASSTTAGSPSAASNGSTHVSSAFVEWSDRDRAWYASLGRQNRSSSGSFGTFDGAFGSYRWLPHLTTDVTLGMPTDSSRSGVNTKRPFASVALELGTFFSSLEPSFYLTQQQLEGRVDRQAVGAELRYFKPGRVLIGFVDYDVHFKVLNSAVLVGTLQLPARWTVNIDAEQRKSPLVTTRNALIGQPTRNLTGDNGLTSAFSDEQIRQLALDRTPELKSYSVSASRAIGERLQLTLTGQHFSTSATPPSDGSDMDARFVQVEGTPADGPQYIYSAQLLAASVMRAGDVNIIGVRHQSGGQFDASALAFSSRFPVGRDWRLGPQFQVDRRQFATDNTMLWLYSPSARLTWQRPRMQLDVEAGAEFNRRQSDVDQQRSTRLFFYLGYRWLF